MKFDGENVNVNEEEVGECENICGGDASDDLAAVSASAAGGTDVEIGAVTAGGSDVESNLNRVLFKTGISSCLKEKNMFRVIINDDRCNPLIAVGAIFKQEKRIKRSNKKRTRFGRYKRPDQKKRKKDAVTLPSVVSAKTFDNSTISSLSTDSDARKDNVQRSLARNKRRMWSLVKENKKTKNKIDCLNKKIDRMNNDFIQEKRASNYLLAKSMEDAAKSRENAAEIMAAAKTILEESKRLKGKNIKRASEDYKTNQEGTDEIFGEDQICKGKTSA